MRIQFSVEHYNARDFSNCIPDGSHSDCSSLVLRRINRPQALQSTQRTYFGLGWIIFSTRHSFWSLDHLALELGIRCNLLFNYVLFLFNESDGRWRCEAADGSTPLGGSILCLAICIISTSLRGHPHCCGEA